MIESRVQALQPRFVDLMAPFRQFDYYHPDQLGSTSLKVALPALSVAVHIIELGPKHMPV